MAEPREVDLGKALAPDDSIFDIIEGDTVDPLDGGEIEVDEENPLGFTVDEPISDSRLSGLTDDSIEMTTDFVGDNLDEIEIVDDEDVVDVVEIPEGDAIGGNEIEVVDFEDELDYDQPGELVASILNKARAFVKYDVTSANSVKRAEAFCNTLERMITTGVTKDALSQKLTLAQLRLLDDIQEGIVLTKTALQRNTTNKKVYAKSIGDQGLLGGAYDPFCATVARILINAQVQGGKKVQDVFQSLKDKYDISEREALQISQVMADLGYPVRSLVDGQDMIDQFYA